MTAEGGPQPLAFRPHVRIPQAVPRQRSLAECGHADGRNGRTAIRFTEPPNILRPAPAIWSKRNFMKPELRRPELRGLRRPALQRELPSCPRNPMIPADEPPAPPPPGRQPGKRGSMAQQSEPLWITGERNLLRPRRDRRRDHERPLNSCSRCSRRKTPRWCRSSNGLVWRRPPGRCQIIPRREPGFTPPDDVKRGHPPP